MSLFHTKLPWTSWLWTNNRLRAARTLHNTSIRRVHYFDVSPETFKHRIAAKDRLVLVDFYANWCGPCKIISPILKRLSNEMKTKDGLSIDLLTVDTDSEESIPLAASNKIRVLPTIIAFKDGKAIDQFVGAIPEDSIREFIERQ